MKLYQMNMECAKCRGKFVEIENVKTKERENLKHLEIIGSINEETQRQMNG